MRDNNTSPMVYVGVILVTLIILVAANTLRTHFSPEEPQEEDGARDSLFFVDREEMEKTYSIPSAFGAYTGYFRERY